MFDEADVIRAIVLSLLIASALLAPQSVAAPVAASPNDITVRAVTCRLSVPEMASLPTAIRRDVADAAAPVRHLALPSGNLYWTGRPVSALGYVTSEIYVAPARVMLVVDRPLSDVTQALGLRAIPYGPSSKPAGAGRSMIAYQLHQEGLEGRTLVGCEYHDPTAAFWLGDGSQ